MIKSKDIISFSKGKIELYFLEETSFIPSLNTFKILLKYFKNKIKYNMNLLKKDNVLTIPVPNSAIVFTRYLYIKDEVKLALLISLLNKSKNALFWAYELFWSGFQIELLSLLFKIYYDFFATVNPTFELYLNKKKTIYLSELVKREKIVAYIVNNLLIRDFNTDVFMMRKICELFEPDPELRDRREVYRILSSKEVKETNKEILDSEFVPAKIILLAKMLTKKLDDNNKNNNKKKHFYLKVDGESMLQYRTLTVTPVYRTLATACKIGIDDDKMLNMFKLARTNEPNLLEKYNARWLYSASFSPLWFERIQMFKGYIDYMNQTVKFVTEEWEEGFYEKYGYEPDEQPLETKERVLTTIGVKELKELKGAKEKINTWATFYFKYKNNNVMDVLDEELEEFDALPLVY